MTLIDTIYTNSFSNDIFGGNLLMEIADHPAQFISVVKDNAYKSQPNYYKRDYSQWNDQNLDDLSLQIWDHELKT